MQGLSELSLRQKVGQLVICGFHGTEPSQDIKELIEKHHIGGVVYFSRNVKTPMQVFQLSKELQAKSLKHSKLPLLVSIDQEGGMVARIVGGMTLTPGNMAIGATRKADYAYKCAKISGKELRALGINVNLAPCLDINNNPLNTVIGVRSYGEQVQLVADMGIAAIRGYQENQVAATVKHFPGHGDTSVDSHLDLPYIPHSLDRLNDMELMPFKQAIRADVDAIMTAHVVFPAIEDTGLPATLSPKVVSQLLRKELQYDGLVMTDCMEMNAIVDHYGTEEAAVLAIEAGVDIVFVSHTFAKQLGVIEGLVQAVETGRLTEKRIDASIERVLRLKKKRVMECFIEDWNDAEKQIRQEEDRQLVRKISEESVTLIKDEQRLLPLHRQKPTFVIWPQIEVTSGADDVLTQATTLGECLKKEIDPVCERSIPVQPSEDVIAAVVEEASGFEQIVVATYNATHNSGQLQLIQELLKCKQDGFTVVAVRNPFDLNAFPEISTYVACYESRPLALRSTAQLLVGKITAEGKLPVTIF